MNLKNKDITEGMRVSNRKDKLKVISWDKSYSDCLLNYIDSKGNRYVIAWDYKLSGTEKDPQIEWMNGRYFTANSDDEAFETYVDYLGEVHEYDISESKKSVRKSLHEDSLDDIIPMAHSEYFDTLVEFFKDYDVPIKISHTANGGKICYVKNDIELITVIYKSVKDKYELLGHLELSSDGSTTLWNKHYRGSYYKHVPLEEVWIWDTRKDEFVNYKGKVLKNINYDDIVESKKTKNTSIKESAKPINEKNVAKFVGELNEWVADNVHYKDLESAQFTIKYGKLYDFKYGWDYSYGDKGLLKVWDEEGTLDWFEESYVKDFIVNLAKKYGWYCEAVTNDSDFTFSEL